MRLRIAYILLVLAISIEIGTFREGVASMRPLINIDEESVDLNQIGMFDMIEMDVDMSLGCFASEITSTSYGANTDSTSYYIVPVWSAADDSLSYIAIKVKEQDTMTYEKIVDATIDYLTGETQYLGKYSVHVMGCLREMKSKEYKYYEEFFQENQWFESQEELEQYALPLCLEPTAHADLSKKLMIFGFGILAISILLFIGEISERAKRRKMINERKKEIAQSQMSVVIDGVHYPKSKFDGVNDSIRRRDRQTAVQELRNITGIDLADANIIIDNWNSYYY